MVLFSALVCVLLGLSGCHRGQRKAAPPAPEADAPAVPAPQPARPAAPRSSANGSYRPSPIPITPVPPGGVSKADLRFIDAHAPVYSEEGLATWYTAPYKGRRAANGQVFSDKAMTAAHRTLPMGSLIVVTNIKTGQSSAMRVTDRGPFVDGRIVDLTVASAKATGIYQSGMSKVRVDVYQTPKPIDVGGRWCVQIGAFKSEHKALRLKSQLLRTYPDAQVIEFPGEASYWVRIRPQGDNRQEAEYIAHHLRPAEGEAFLTRLD
jgi:rare lipoprotein A